MYQCHLLLVLKIMIIMKIYESVYSLLSLVPYVVTNDAERCGLDPYGFSVFSGKHLCSNELVNSIKDKFLEYKTDY
jgi:hypothetical protein